MNLKNRNEVFRTVSISERHVGFLKNNLGRTFEKQIIFHEEKILNPSIHIKPESFRVKITGKGGDMKYVHPTNTHLKKY